MRLLRILLAFVRSAVQHEFAYRADLVGNVIGSALSPASAIGGVAVIFAHTDNLSGWSFAQTLALLGVFCIVNGLVDTSVSPSLNKVVEEVREGTFDYIMLKPVPTLFLASTRRIVLWQTADVAMGVALLAVALSRLEAPVTASNALLFVVLMVSGVLIVYAIWIALTTLVFWYVRIVNITMIFSQLFQTGRYPIEVYPFWLRQMLTFVFPVAFITTVPAQTVVGRDPSWLIWAGPPIAVVAALLAARFWRLGLSRYTSASS